MKKIDMRYKLYLVLSAVGIISVVGGVVMIWYTFQMNYLLTNLLEKNVAAFQAAEAMQTALVNQKGFVTYYFLDGNPDWLRQFDELRQVFRKRLGQARLLAQDDRQREAIAGIEQEYEDYIRLKDRVIALYKAGAREEGAKLHITVRSRFSAILNLCEAFKTLHTENIRQVQDKNDTEARRLRYIALSAVGTSSALVLLLTWILAKQIFGPLAGLLVSATGNVMPDQSGNIVSALSNSVHGLIRSVDQTQQELTKSREHLLQAEKLAMVGKLAAGMAHSIRNPFTSVKMRLFSLNRSLKLNPTQKEDFEVIALEIRHIDTIVQNFLEFSRPPKLVMQWVSPSTIVDNTIQLLAHRLKSYNVTVRVVRKTEMPQVVADPEQIKEVLVNIMINACEAMTEGGNIVVEEQINGTSDARQVRLQITDTGPGIPASDQEKIFQPFFTTKDDGTGLGLSIAKNILDEHGGTLTVAPSGSGGASFVLTIPLPTEKDHGHHSDN